jgi:hypothetical protein
MQQRNLTIAVLASAAFFALSTAAGSQVIVSGRRISTIRSDGRSSRLLALAPC